LNGNGGDGIGGDDDYDDYDGYDAREREARHPRTLELHHHSECIGDGCGSGCYRQRRQAAAARPVSRQPTHEDYHLPTTTTTPTLRLARSSCPKVPQ